MSSSPRRTQHLAKTPLFTCSTHALSRTDKGKVSYERARATVRAYELTMDDVLTLSPKFWELHQDPLMALDGAAMTLITIQVNLTTGTIARYAVHRPELVSLVEDLLSYRKHGQFLMTEVGHGLDIANLETTATLQPSGEFLLNTPSPQAAKFMPPTVPAGLPTVAVVWARLFVNGEDRGVRPFIVYLNDGKQMCAGVKSRLLPERGGPNPVNHSITSFSNVRLPPDALLGPLETSGSLKAALNQAIWRVVTGTLAIGSMVLPVMKATATIGTMYSLRRHVGSPRDRVPIMHFRTQQIPILTLTARVYVLEAFQQWCTSIFCDTTVDSRVRHAIAGIFKTTITEHSNAASIAISDRCGVQGLFAHNQLTTMHNETRGIAIAEGDVLVLSIKLATEMLQGLYSVPAPKDPKSLLALHEAGLFQENYATLANSSHHRSSEVNRLILPQCLSIIEAIGHRMAYEAAVAVGVQQDLVDLYVASVVKHDLAWYSENAGFGRRALAEFETKALDAVLPQLGSLVGKMGMEPWISSKIVSDERWNAFVETCPVFEGNGKVQSPRARAPGEKTPLPQQEMVRSHL
ncbi:acyl-CoA dehydrogenase NM domain-like protein [Irpex rosettiformis]|uniref:Acyl-CoA dehydrogenase NM domain-like protein n=1 Tax=Irpex rosettiformis TaxID=378272 RepID=A0ACB8UGV5_9APHY|nr:acyl-CoA dehydrogenase NM domain-like protein [Irpex rosettiformis]